MGWIELGTIFRGEEFGMVKTHVSSCHKRWRLDDT
jgi:hypothetical protein